MGKPSDERTEAGGKGSCGKETVTGICGICPGGCGVHVELIDGRIEKISPIKGHPVGVVCVRGVHAKEIVYSSDRLKHPLLRVGERGEGQVRAHHVGRGARSNRRRLREDQAAIRAGGRDELFRPRRFRVRLLRRVRVPRPVDRGKLGLPLPVRFPQCGGRFRGLLCLLRLSGLHHDHRRRDAGDFCGFRPFGPGRDLGRESPHGLAAGQTEKDPGCQEAGRPGGRHRPHEVRHRQDGESVDRRAARERTGPSP